MAAKAISVAILAMGGEGGGVLADWIVDLAESCGYVAQTTSVPGVAQRTGSTIYYLELFPEAAGKDPVLALMPVPGEVDIVLASELMEAGRAVQRGLVTPDRTVLIASTHRVYSMIEKTAPGDGRVDSEALIEATRAAARKFVPADFAQIAGETKSVISAALFGALAATTALPFQREQFEDAIRRGGVGVESSLRAFAGGWKAAAASAGETACTTTSEPAPSMVGQAVSPAILRARIQREFPPPAHEILIAGVERLADYQDERYAAEYLDRLTPIQRAGQGDFTLLRETARYLALWMSYEDATRVADLKIRPSRFERVRQESRVDPSQLVRIHEFLHPRVAEIADILPAALGTWLLASGWPRRLLERFTRRGRVVETTSIRGFLQLYFLASLRPWRRRSLRFRREHRRIDEWLALIPPIAAQNGSLAREVAECPRLLKGYGDTYIRGSLHFDAVISILPTLQRMEDAASRLRKLREAALADESGEQLTEALTQISDA